MFDIVLKNALCVSSKERKKQNIAIKDGLIAYTGEDLPDAGEVFDLEGKIVLPGVIDSQVHFREPGPTHKEDLATGSMAAALGGVTTFFEMPNTSPATTSVEALKDKIERANEKSVTDFGFYIGANGKNLEELKKAHELDKCVGIKIFLGSSTMLLILLLKQHFLFMML